MFKRSLRRAVNSVLVAVAVFTLVSFSLPCFSFFVTGQSEMTLNATDRFDIPANNSSISFATNGTYEEATLDNEAWSFTNLRLINSQKLNLKVSATDCEVKIFSYFIFNRTSRGETARWFFLSYTVIGLGTQTFELGLDPSRGEWGVVFNGDFTGITHGWNLSPDGNLIITGATANVTLTYFGYPNSFLESTDDVNQHYILIGSTLFLAAVVALSATITMRKKGTERLQGV